MRHVDAGRDALGSIDAGMIGTSTHLDARSHSLHAQARTAGGTSRASRAISSF
jgi:hypothetical protein